MIVMGLDPGTIGSYAFIDSEDGTITAGDLPVHRVGTTSGKRRVELDLHGLCRIIRKARPNHIIIEQYQRCRSRASPAHSALVTPAAAYTAVLPP
jgi:hypothetical protein